MAFDEIWSILVFIVQFAVILFPTVYLLDKIRARIETKTFGRTVVLIFFMSLLLSLAVYPFLASLGEAIISLETGVNVSLMPFDSDIMTYFAVLLFVFLIYLIVFNKTK